MERKKNEHITYVVVTYVEARSSNEMNYLQAEMLKKELDATEDDCIHRIEPVNTPLKEG